MVDLIVDWVDGKMKKINQKFYPYAISVNFCLLITLLIHHIGSGQGT